MQIWESVHENLQIVIAIELQIWIESDWTCTLTCVTYLWQQWDSFCALDIPLMSVQAGLQKPFPVDQF